MINRSRYDGMTLNERLFEAGLMQAFHEAARANDRAEMVRLLTTVDVQDPSFSVDTILKNPERYGYE